MNPRKNKNKSNIQKKIIKLFLLLGIGIFTAWYGLKNMHTNKQVVS